MRLEDSKGNWLIGLGIVLLGGVFFSGNGFNFGPNPKESEESVGYQMIRPQSFSAKFDLSNRMVDRRIKSLEKSNAKVETLGDKTNAKAPSANVAAKDKKHSKKQDSQKAKSAKKIFEANVISDDYQRMAGLVESDDTTVAGSQIIVYNSNPEKKNAERSENEDPRMSLAQWKEILFSSPTNSNGLAFLAAMRKAEINAEGFYTIAAELLSSENKNHKKLSLYLLAAQPHPRVIEVLVLNSSSITDEFKAETGELIESYSNRDKLNHLARLLVHPELSVALEATRILSMAVAKAQSVQGQDREARNSLLPTPEVLSHFLPVLQRISKSQGSEISDEAQDLYSRIQALLG